MVDPANKVPPMTPLPVCNRVPQEKSEHPVSRETQELWYEQRRVKKLKEFFFHTEIMKIYLSYRVFLVLRA